MAFDSPEAQLAALGGRDGTGRADAKARLGDDAWPAAREQLLALFEEINERDDGTMAAEYEYLETIASVADGAAAHRLRPCSSHGSGAVSPTIRRCWSRLRSVCSIATGRRLPEPRVVGVVEEADHEQRRDDDHDDGADQHALDDRVLAAVGEEEHEADDHARP